MNNVYFLAALAYAAFSATDASVKAVGPYLPIFTIMFVVNAFAAGFLLLTHHDGERWSEFWRSSHPLPIHARAGCGVISSFTGLYGISTVPLAEFYALIFLTPLFVTVMSGWLLREAIGPWRWSAVLAGLIGAVIVIRPGMQQFQLGHIAAMCCGVSTGTAILLMRGMKGPVKKTSVLATLMLYLVVSSVIAMVFSGTVLPDFANLFILAFAGVCFGVGQWALITAARTGAASQVAPLHYTQLVWGTTFGILLFHEFPDRWTIIGLVVIAASGLITIAREAVRRRDVAIPPGPQPIL